MKEFRFYESLRSVCTSKFYVSVTVKWYLDTKRKLSELIKVSVYKYKI